MMTCNTKKEPSNLCKSNSNKQMFINSLHYKSNIMNAAIIFLGGLAKRFVYI